MLFSAVVAGCYQRPEPIPLAHADYVGVWEHGAFAGDGIYVHMQITADGWMTYARSDRSGRSSRCTNYSGIRVQRIAAGNISALMFWPFELEFVTDGPPRRVDGMWRMKVDGDPLKKTDDRREWLDFKFACDGGLKREARR